MTIYGTLHNYFRLILRGKVLFLRFCGEKSITIQSNTCQKNKIIIMILYHKNISQNSYVKNIVFVVNVHAVINRDTSFPLDSNHFVSIYLISTLII